MQAPESSRYIFNCTTPPETRPQPGKHYTDFGCPQDQAYADYGQQYIDSCCPVGIPLPFVPLPDFSG